MVNITGMLMDQFLNLIESTLNTTSGDDFLGIIGLGEKVGPDFFYKDGVYSLWSRDTPSPVEDGKSPGKNIYGTHPFNMFKNDKNCWVGVFTNLAHAQDWWISNNQESGQVNVTSIATGGVADIYFF